MMDRTAGKKTVGELGDFVISELKKGTPRKKIIAGLESRGLQRGLAPGFVGSIESELRMLSLSRRANWASVPAAVLFGFFGVFISDILWLAVIRVTGSLVSFMAIFVGMASGFFVLGAASGKRGGLLQAVSFGVALVGILAGGYFGFCASVSGWPLQASADLWGAFIGSINGFDLFFALVGLFFAWSIPRRKTLWIC